MPLSALSPLFFFLPSAAFLTPFLDRLLLASDSSLLELLFEPDELPDPDELLSLPDPELLSLSELELLPLSELELLPLDESESLPLDESESLSLSLSLLLLPSPPAAAVSPIAFWSSLILIRSLMASTRARSGGLSVHVGRSFGFLRMAVLDARFW